MLSADGSINDVVDAADLAVWKARFGGMTPETTTLAAIVPEPTTAEICLVALAFVLMAAQRPRSGYMPQER